MCMQIATGDDYTHFEGSVHGGLWWELWWNIIDHVTRLRGPMGFSNPLKSHLTIIKPLKRSKRWKGNKDGSMCTPHRLPLYYSTMSTKKGLDFPYFGTNLQQRSRLLNSPWIPPKVFEPNCEGKHVAWASWLAGRLFFEKCCHASCSHWLGYMDWYMRFSVCHLSMLSSISGVYLFKRSWNSSMHTLVPFVNNEDQGNTMSVALCNIVFNLCGAEYF